MSTLTAAVIGCGDISVVHAAAITNMDDVELVGVCDTNEHRRAVASSAHDVPGYADHLSLLDSAKPDVVHITTPHSSHSTIAIDCLERGVNVVLEKPLAHTLEEGQRLVEAARVSTAKIAVCFQNRYNAAVQAMRATLESGEVGTIKGASATVFWQRDANYYGNRPWRSKWESAGGGLMMNQAIHTVDLLQWLVGEVASLSGNSSTRFLGDSIEVEDTAEFVAAHENGARSAFYATLANAVNAPITLDVVTERATLSLRGDLTISYGDGRVEVVPERRSPSGQRAYWGASHELLIADFYDRLTKADPFWIDPEEAMKSLRIVKELYRQSYPLKAETVI